MADLSITAANVIAQAGAIIDRSGIAGETITAGKTVLKDATDKYVLSDSDAGGLKGVDGIALNGAAVGQPLAVHKKGPLAMGAVFTAGLAYYLSNTAGGICPVADVGAGEDSILIGLAASTTVLNVDVQDPGVTV